MAKKKLNQLDPGTPTLTQIFGHANPTSGKMFRAPLSELLALFEAQTPVTTFANEAALLANTDLVIGYLAYVADSESTYLYQGPDPDDIGNYTLIGGGGDEHFKGLYLTEAALISAHPAAEPGDYAYVDAGIDYPVELWIWDETDTEWVFSGSGAIVPDADATTKGIAKLDPNTSLGSATDAAPTQNAAKVYADAKVADAITDAVTTIAPSQNAVFDALALKQDLLNSATALTDASSMALTAIKHTLTTSSATRTFTITYTGDDISIKVILNATSSVFTFPAGALCVSEGIASGNNTCPLAGVSGDVYVFAIKHWDSAVYTVVCKNTGQ